LLLLSFPPLLFPFFEMGSHYVAQDGLELQGSVRHRTWLYKSMLFSGHGDFTIVTWFIKMAGYASVNIL
jgi:hypothetical protein